MNTYRIYEETRHDRVPLAVLRLVRVRLAAVYLFEITCGAS